MSENPVLAALEVYRRTHPHRAEEVDEAFARYSEAESAVTAQSHEDAADEGPLAASEQLPLEDDGEE